MTRHDLSTPAASATVDDQGAHLVAWAPEGRPVLWTSPDGAPEGRPLRGGVPICFPWFGPGRSGDRTPTHGPARTTAWRLVEQGEGTVTYAVTGAELGRPETFEATYVVRAGEQLDITLTVHNTGDEELTYEEALHPYLVVGDVREVSVEGLEGGSYEDKTDDYRECRQDGPVRLVGEVDRVYRSAAPVTVVDPVLGRRLRTTTTGAASRILWNPGAEVAATYADIGDAWTGFVCVEGGNVRDGELTLAPGDSHTLGYRLEVLPL